MSCCSQWANCSGGEGREPFLHCPLDQRLREQFARATNPQIRGVIELLHHFPLLCRIGNTFRSIAD